jgi:23S rRNA pseudouridine1911/1915/1917 synthase
MTTRSVPVPDGLDGLRLDQAVSRLFGLSRSAAAALVEAGDALVDGVPRPKAARTTTSSWWTSRSAWRRTRVQGGRAPP